MYKGDITPCTVQNSKYLMTLTQVEMISTIILVLAERFLQAPVSFLIRKSNDKGNGSGIEPCKDLFLFLVQNSSVSGLFFSGIPSQVAAVWEAGGCQEDRETNERMNVSCSRSRARHVSTKGSPCSGAGIQKRKLSAKRLAQGIPSFYKIVVTK